MRKPTNSLSECVKSAAAVQKKLIHGTSDAARSANIATERRAGKPAKQAIAIGYSVQREARKKKR